MTVGGALTGPIVLKNLKENLRCSVCFEVYINPRCVKFCAHTFCSHCMKETIRASTNARCPLCSKGEFCRRKGWTLDKRVHELCLIMERFSAPLSPTAKTDGYLENRPRLAVKRGSSLSPKPLVAKRKQRGRSTFSLESDTEDILRLNTRREKRRGDQGQKPIKETFPSVEKDFSQEGAILLSDDRPMNSSRSLLVDEKHDESLKNLIDDKTSDNDTKENSVNVTFDGEELIGTENIDGATSFSTLKRGPKSSGKQSRSVPFFKSGSLIPKRNPLSSTAVCRFFILSSLVPKEEYKVNDQNTCKYLSFEKIILSNKENDDVSSTILKRLSSKSHTSCSSKKTIRSRRLINDNFSGIKMNSFEEDGNEEDECALTKKRLSKERICSAIAKENTPKSITDKFDSPPEKDIECTVLPAQFSTEEILAKPVSPEKINESLDDVYDDDNLPSGPMSLKKLNNSVSDTNRPEEKRQRESENEEGQTTQEMIRNLTELKKNALELQNNIRENVLPSDEDEEIFPGTPENLTKKRKRSSLMTNSSSSRKRLTATVGFEFHAGIKIISTGIQTQTQLQKYNEFIAQFKDQVSFVGGEFNDSISIVVVSTTEDDNDFRCNRTVKYLMAVAAGKIVVSIKWIEDSLNERNLLNPMNYIVKDFSGSDGPERSLRRTKDSLPLFSQYEFGLLGEFGQALPGEQIVKLIHLSGGRVVRNLNIMTFAPGRTNLLIIDKDYSGEDGLNVGEASEIFHSSDIAVIDKDWIVESIGKYSPQPLLGYLQHAADYNQLKSLGYNESLLS